MFCPFAAALLTSLSANGAKKDARPRDAPCAVGVPDRRLRRDRRQREAVPWQAVPDRRAEPAAGFAGARCEQHGGQRVLEARPGTRSRDAAIRVRRTARADGPSMLPELQGRLHWGRGYLLDAVP